MEDTIKTQLPMESQASEKSPSERQSAMSLDFEEANALRYCGGYLLRSLKKKINKSAHPLKEALLKHYCFV